MNQERQINPQEKQATYKRLLMPDSGIAPQKYDTARRLSANTVIFTLATATDMAESHLVDWLIRKPLQQHIETADSKVHTFPQDYAEQKGVTSNELFDDETFLKQHEVVRKAAVRAEGVEKAADFIEEWASDKIYANVMNAWLRSATGDPNAAYVSEAADFISEWANKILQVFAGNPIIGLSEKNPNLKAHSEIIAKRNAWGIKLGYEAADLINSVNVEAAMRILEEVPIVRIGIHKMREGIEHAMENRIIRTLHTIADLGVMGYFFGTSQAKVHHHT